MEAGRRVFSDATQNSPSGCKKLGKHGSRKRAVRRSAHLITDYKGDEYERVEYTPYGEYWIEKRATENRTLPFKFTGKERDEETGLYYYGARYLDAKTSRWLTTDPALGEYMAGNSNGMSGGIFNTINFNLYHYAGNNPIRYTDPTGMESSDEIMQQIKSLQAEMANSMNEGQEITTSQMDIFNSLMGDYNRAIIDEGRLNVDDYIENGTITTDFEEAQDAIGNYRVNFHTGIDVVGGDLKTPFFIRGIGGSDTGSNEKTFEIIGTDLKMRVLHGDANGLKMSQDFYKPGDTVMSFPKKNNFSIASTGRHFHIELSNGSNFVNPFTLKQSSKEFCTTFDGGKTWIPRTTKF
ncbi:RHS repeat-associated core domain-containing protein [Treponema sp. OMZ 840]|uniref:RHS repeat-associated core domain-containing protein n=1 Tax=Treponema sp. OMZ 840 TaxID=244313 RepID=UPI003D8E69E5